MNDQIECSVVQVEQYGVSLSVLGYPNDYIMQCMTKGRLYESDLLGEIYRRYGKGGVYVDFGAFIGTHTMFFSKMCEADLVIAVEPNEMSYTILTENLKRNSISNVDAFNCAVGEKPHRGTPIKCGINEGTFGVMLSDGVSGTIPIIAASALITAPPKLIKIDCENSSLSVLLGCMPVILEHKPVIVIETDEMTTDELIKSAGYKLYDTFGQTPTNIYEPA